MIEIRLGKEGEEKEICVIADQYSTELGWVSHGEIRTGLQQKRVYVAEVDGVMVGYVHYYTRKDKLTRLYSMCVDGEYLNRGIGRMLLQVVPTPLVLSCPEKAEAAQRFYESCGLEKTRVKEGRKQMLIEYRK